MKTIFLIFSFVCSIKCSAQTIYTISHYKQCHIDIDANEVGCIEGHTPYFIEQVGVDLFAYIKIRQDSSNGGVRWIGQKWNDAKMKKAGDGFTYEFVKNIGEYNIIMLFKKDNSLQEVFVAKKVDDNTSVSIHLYPE